MEVIDLPRGGVALSGVVAVEAGNEVEVELTGASRALPGRVTRVTGDRTAVAFRQDPGTLALIDLALASLRTQSVAA
jgi:hypothetical protein